MMMDVGQGDSNVFFLCFLAVVRRYLFIVEFMKYSALIYIVVVCMPCWSCYVLLM